MANTNFIVQNGLTAGPVVINATTGDITTSGNISVTGSGSFGGLSSNQIYSGSSNVTVTASTVNIAISSSNVATFSSTGLILAGNLTVNGTTTTVNQETINTSLIDAGTLSVGSTATLNALVVNTTSTLNGTVTCNNITPSANANANIGTVSSQFNTIFARATSAQYADLAENYLADAEYAPGTVVVFGGDKEITISNTTHDNRVAGVVSTDPAYLMNSGLSAGTAVAFTGRVPCRVMGPVYKGQPLVQGMNWGIAEGLNPDYFTPGCVLGKALADIDDKSIQTIEVAVGRF